MPDAVPPGSAGCCAIVELRQYTLHPGRRDELIELFEREFVDTQEATGLTLIGQFRDLDRPQYFVWLRGFPDMATRAASLQAFYTSAAWQQHRNAANATMIDSDDVLMLEPATRNTRNAPFPDRGPKSADARGHLIVVTLYYPQAAAMQTFGQFFAESMRTPLMEAGAAILGEYVTSTQQNNFPRLPIREGERAFVTLARFESERDHAAFQAKLAADARWRTVASELATRLERPVQTLRLAPTARSRL